MLCGYYLIMILVVSIWILCDMCMNWGLYLWNCKNKLWSLVLKECIDVNCFLFFWIVKIKRVCFENVKLWGVVLLKLWNKNVRKKIDVYIRYF